MSEEKKTINLICKACGAEMTVDEDERIASCQYCGSKELIKESDAVKIERIKSKTYKDIELERMRQQKEIQEKYAEEEEVKRFKKSILSKVLILMLIVSVAGVFADFKAFHILSGLVSVLQLAAFGGAWLTGMHMIKPKVKNMHTLLAIVGFLLFIPGAALAGSSSSSGHSDPTSHTEVTAPAAETKKTEEREETEKATEPETKKESKAETKKETKKETIKETKAPETEKQAAAGIDPDFKEMMDGYEQFINDYVDFMQRYQESDDVFSMMTEYTQIMQDYTEYMEKIDAVNEDDLNDAELAYYIEVTGRVLQKLQEIN